MYAEHKASLISAERRREQYDYDRDNRMTGITDVLENQTRLTYDGNDKLISLIDGENRTITYTYDSVDLLIEAAEDGAVTHYTYDSVGNVRLRPGTNSGTYHRARLLKQVATRALGVYS